VRIVKRAVVYGALGLIVAAALGWMSLFVYWHIRIGGAIRTLDGRAGREETSRASDMLMEAGCRSIPYLISAIDPERDQPWIWRTIREMAGWAASTGPMETVRDDRTGDSLDLLGGLTDDPGKTAAQRRERHARLRDWWTSDGPLFHQWWRVWSSRCGS
jgi:hypothetical protein